jgi:hypothetical protein
MYSLKNTFQFSETVIKIVVKTSKSNYHRKASLHADTDVLNLTFIRY